jgi:hypothetical protein
MATQQIKDILDTEFPSPTKALIPTLATPEPGGLEVDRFSSTGTPRTLDPRTQRFEGVSVEGEPRIYGDRQALLIERPDRTQKTRHNTDPQLWGFSENVIFDVSHTNVLGGRDATGIIGGNQDSNARVAQVSGTTPSGKMTIRALVGRSSANRFGVGWRNQQAGKSPTYIEYEWGSDTVSVGASGSGSVDNYHARRLGTEVNGRDFVEIRATFAPDSAGDTMQTYLYPDLDGNNGAIISHYVSIEDGINATSPLLNTDNQRKRGGDTAAVDLKDWYNPNQGTFYVEYTPLVWNIESSHHIPLFLTGGGEQINVIYLDPTNSSGETTVQNFFGNGEGVTAIPHGAKVFQKNKMLMSYNDDENSRVISSNGISERDSADVGAYKSVNTLRLGDNNLVGLFHKVTYSPSFVNVDDAAILTS